MRKPYHPDDSGMTWQNGGGNNNGNGNGGGKGYGSGFNIIRPVETRTLAQDMADEFGGSVAGWRRNINQPARTFNFGAGAGGNGNGNGGNNHGNGGGNPSDGGPNQPGDGGFDPSSPRNRMAPMAMQRPMMQTPQQGLLSASLPGLPMANTPGMLAAPYYPRDHSILGVPSTQIAPQQPQGLLGDIPPEVLAYIRTGGMR